jgi:hypothetical protein
VYSSRERRIIHSTSVIFTKFQNLPVKKNIQKGDLDFVLNQIALKLGKEEMKSFLKTKKKS